MSRGGRGGFRGGKSTLSSQLGLDFDEKALFEVVSEANRTFPKYELLYAEVPTTAERVIVNHYRTLRSQVHDGAHYCMLPKSSTYRVSKSSKNQRTPATAFFDAFEDQSTYVQKFKKSRNALPNLKAQLWVREYFPVELWPTMGEKDDIKKNKTLKISTKTRIDNWSSALDEDGEADAANDDVNDDNADAEKENNDANMDDREEDDENAEDDADPDQFDDDDDDNDYNAEQYFSPGEDDDGGDDDGGGRADGDL